MKMKYWLEECQMRNQEVAWEGGSIKVEANATINIEFEGT